MLHIDPKLQVKPDTAQRYMSLHILPYVNGNKQAFREEMTYFLEMHPEHSYRLLLAYAVTKTTLLETLTTIRKTPKNNLKITLDSIIEQ
jgi:hypothetical protein